jgi:soluble lytic murein transglycosylase-like protein
LWAAYGDNIALPLNDAEAGKRGPLVINVKASPDGDKNVAFIEELLPPDEEDTEAMLAPNEAVYSHDPHTEKKIFNYITRRHRKVPKNEASQIASSIVHSSKKHMVDPFLVTALVERESNFKKDAVSIHGAQGLGQIMPFNLAHLNISDAFSISENISGTAQYLKQQLGKWSKTPEKSVELALASYAEGPNAITRQQGRWKNKTNGYIKDIMSRYHKLLGSPEPDLTESAELNVGFIY